MENITNLSLEIEKWQNKKTKTNVKDRKSKLAVNVSYRVHRKEFMPFTQAKNSLMHWMVLFIHSKNGNIIKFCTSLLKTYRKKSEI